MEVCKKNIQYSSLFLENTSVSFVFRSLWFFVFFFLCIFCIWLFWHVLLVEIHKCPCMKTPLPHRDICSVSTLFFYYIIFLRCSFAHPKFRRNFNMNCQSSLYHRCSTFSAIATASRIQSGQLRKTTPVSTPFNSLQTSAWFFSANCLVISLVS